MDIAKPIAKKFSDSILCYLRLWRYLTRRIEQAIAGRATHRLSTCQDFYNHVAFGDIKDGDRIKLKEFFATEWIPREPGACASWARTGDDGKKAYVSLPERTCCFTHGLIRNDWKVPLIGSFRLPLVEQEYIPLGLVTAGEYLTDLGIIVLMSKSVYSQFLARQHRFDAVEADLEGFVSLAFPSRSRIDIKDKQDDTPRSFDPVIVVDSPLQATFRTHSGHPRINAPLFRGVRYSEPPLVGMKGLDELQYGEEAEVDVLFSTMSGCDPDELASVELIVSKMIPGSIIECKSGTARASEFASFFQSRPRSEKKEDDRRNISMKMPLSSAETQRFIESLRANLEGKELSSPEPKYGDSLEDYNVIELKILTEFDGRRSVLRPVLPVRSSLQPGREGSSVARDVIQGTKRLESSRSEEKPNNLIEGDEK
jgi:hypothetical protein